MQVKKYATGAFSWLDLETPDNEAAKKFYTTLFGWSAEDAPNMPEGQVYTMYSLDGHSVAGSSLPNGDHPPHWNTYFTTYDIAASVKKVGELGGKVVSEPFPVFDAGMMAVISDPQGAFFMLWQPDQHIGSGLADAVGSLCWNHLATDDIEAAGRFYCALFNMTSAMDQDSLILTTAPDDGDGVRAGQVASIGPREESPISAWCPFISVVSIEETLKLATSLGAQMAYPKNDIGYGFIAGIIDPQGAYISVFEPKSWE